MEDVESAIQRRLDNSRIIVVRALGKMRSGSVFTDDISLLKGEADQIRASGLLIDERFVLKAERAGKAGAKAVYRHQNISSGFRKLLEEYLNLVSYLPAGENVTPTHLETVLAFLDRNVRKRKRPILGSLPYKNLNYQAKEPSAQPVITPAYRGGDKTVGPDDLKGTAEAPVSQEIAELARALNWSPVLIYEYVKNNMDTEWYWGCMKGAEGTLRQKSGNDCDQATLLVALLRASNYPARYVRGVIDFPAGLDKLKNITGVGNTWKLAEFFQKVGIPYKPIVSSGGIGNLQIEHIWVETQVPYANYRGAIIDDNGKTWLALDTSIKVKDYQYNTPRDIFGQSAVGGQLSGIRSEYLGMLQTQTPLEYLKAKISDFGSQMSPQLTADDYMLKRSLVPEVMNILPAGLQFNEVKVIGEYVAMPEELFHKAKFTAKSGNAAEELFELTLPVYSLSGQSVAVRFEPETVEDQAIINSYGGQGNTPPYLVRLRPTITLNGNMIVAGKDGMPMGDDCLISIELISPGGIEKISSTHIAGNLAVIGIVAQKVVAPTAMAADTRNAERLMYEEALNHIDRWNKAEDELASLLRVGVVRPVPSVVTTGGIVDISYLLDMPNTYQWKGVFVDANFRGIETIDSTQQGEGRQKLFMTLSALQGSILENRIFEDDFKVQSVSTAKLFQVNNQRSTDSGRQSTDSNQLIINKNNIESILPTLPYDDNIKLDIQNSVNQNLAVTIPVPSGGQPADITYEDWIGIGYIKENLETGEAGYMLTGMTAGGMTAWSETKWTEYWIGRIFNPLFAEPPVTDPLSAHNIRKVTATDLQDGEVNKELALPLMVIVTDKDGKNVADAEVKFTVKAGGGKLISSDAETDTLIVKTGGSGIAQANYRLGKETKNNPAYKLFDSDKYQTQVGENIISVALNKSGISTQRPFTAYGLPGKPDKFSEVAGGDRSGHLYSWIGYRGINLKDEYGNPVSNATVVFTALQGTDDDGVAVNDRASLAMIESNCNFRSCGPLQPGLSDVTDTKGSALAYGECKRGRFYFLLPLSLPSTLRTPYSST